MRSIPKLVAPALLTVAAFASPTRAHAAEKAGRFSITAKVGPAIKLDDSFLQVSASPEFKVAVDGDYNAYFGIAPQFQYTADVLTMNFPALFQYDIELPVDGLYLYPKLYGGLSYVLETGRPAGFIEPAIGLKYQAHEYVHVVLEPVGVPLYIGRYFAAQFHMFVGVGVDL
ncbi:MAG: hypothetical protein JNK04_02965 [Myxococcales bacterium]|nr:hypothetical protein [Myxococcales bacterium]